jgi:hypothetical protein
VFLHVGIHADADSVIRVPRNSRLSITRAMAMSGSSELPGAAISC